MSMDQIFTAALLSEIELTIGDDNEVVALCQSPIERRFAKAFIVYCAIAEGRPLLVVWKDYVARPPIIIQPQYSVDGRYRADFVISYGGAAFRDCAIVVECDGHEFHEKTKEQAARDKARDRYLSGRFAKVLRFTGSEIHNRPFECATEVFSALDALYCDWGRKR